MYHFSPHHRGVQQNKEYFYLFVKSQLSNNPDSVRSLDGLFFGVGIPYLAQGYILIGWRKVHALPFGVACGTQCPLLMAFFSLSSYFLLSLWLLLYQKGLSVDFEILQGLLIHKNIKILLTNYVIFGRTKGGNFKRCPRFPKLWV